jgi:hypothetical protein
MNITNQAVMEQTLKAQMINGRFLGPDQIALMFFFEQVIGVLDDRVEGLDVTFELTQDSHDEPALKLIQGQSYVVFSNLSMSRPVQAELWLDFGYVTGETLPRAGFNFPATDRTCVFCAADLVSHWLLKGTGANMQQQSEAFSGYHDWLFNEVQCYKQMLNVYNTPEEIERKLK